MRVICSTVEDFIENLRQEMLKCVGAVLQNTIWVSVTQRPIDNTQRSKALKLSITIHASAVIELGEAGQYLLEFNEECGIDYLDGEKEYNGSDQATEYQKKLHAFCDSKNLGIRPGIVDF